MGKIHTYKNVQQVKPGAYNVRPVVKGRRPPCKACSRRKETTLAHRVAGASSHKMLCYVTMLSYGICDVPEFADRSYFAHVLV